MSAYQQILFSEPSLVRMAQRAGDYQPLELADQVLAGWQRVAEQADKCRNSTKTILSLFDESGIWSAPYVKAGYDVIQLDLQNGVDISELTLEAMHEAAIDEVHGILAACPCTHFANCGSQWFEEKDRTGITQEGIDLVHITLEMINYYQPKFWAIENPMGRIRRMCGLPGARLFFEPHHFGDPYTKKTQLFGYFNANLPTYNVFPSGGSWAHRLRGDVPEQKKLRSQTFEGFAYAFFIANQI